MLSTLQSERLMMGAGGLWCIPVVGSVMARLSLRSGRAGSIRCAALAATSIRPLRAAVPMG